jgi:hypothetical protein
MAEDRKRWWSKTTQKNDNREGERRGKVGVRDTTRAFAKRGSGGRASEEGRSRRREDGGGAQTEETKESIGFLERMDEKDYI